MSSDSLSIRRPVAALLSLAHRSGLLLLWPLFSLILFPPALSAQVMEPVRFSARWQEGQADTATVVFTGRIEPGWHVYSTGLEKGGPVSASFKAEVMEGLRLAGELEACGENEVRTMDPVFGMEVRYYEDSVTFIQKVVLERTAFSLEGFLEYGACNDRSCLPPTEFPVSFGAPTAENHSASVLSAFPSEGIYASCRDGLDAAAAGSGSSGWYVLLSGFLGGLVALLTPCVWPIIPLTVSFFLKRSEKRGKALRDAFTYGVSIVVIYLTLGLLVTSLFGASALNAVSTNAVFNLFFFLLLILFGLSFLGVFSLELPSSWSTRVDREAERRTGLVSVFLMALCLAIVSFSCTGPIVGFLLVELSSRDAIWGPLLGMFGFALALALPFTLFALFPDLMRRMPRSLGHLGQVKVILGFVELAFSLKFLSVADLAYGWHILDREVFLSLWIALSLLLCFYLLGWMPFLSGQDDHSSSTRVPMVRFLGALVCLAFAVYLLPGLWGAPLKAVSAFAPPLSTQDFSLYEDEVRAQYLDYEEGMSAARRQNRPVLLDFTGYGCVNCRKMELAVWTDPEVRALLDSYVLISLYVDDKTPLAGGNVRVNDGGSPRTLRTRGDWWSFLEKSKFGANAQPFYVLLDASGRLVGGPYGFQEDPTAFAAFLQEGLDRYRKQDIN